MSLPPVRSYYTLAPICIYACVLYVLFIIHRYSSFTTILCLIAPVHKNFYCLLPPPCMFPLSTFVCVISSISASITFHLHRSQVSLTYSGFLQVFESSIRGHINPSPPFQKIKNISEDDFLWAKLNEKELKPVCEVTAIKKNIDRESPNPPESFAPHLRFRIQIQSSKAKSTVPELQASSGPSRHQIFLQQRHPDVYILLFSFCT